MKKDKDWFLTFMMWVFVFIFCFGVFVAYSIGKPICDYSSNVMTTYKGQIDKYVVESRQVFPYYEDTKKCVVTIQAKVQKMLRKVIIFVSIFLFYGPDPIF